MKLDVYKRQGYTTRDINERMKEHYPTITPGQSWKVEYTESAMKADGSTFMDHDVHAICLLYTSSGTVR